MKRLFEGCQHAALYAAFRPVYPKIVLEHVVNYCKRFSERFEFAVDVGCGSGQSTQLLTKYYTHVIGTDVSAAQIATAAAQIPQVQFQVSSAEDMKFLQNDSVDLVTTAQALHWFDKYKFFEEVRRILHPGGTLAVYGYGMPALDDKDANDMLLEFHNHTLQPYWDEAREHVNNLYKDFTPLPFNDFQRDDTLQMTSTGTLESLKGYLSTWSGYQKYLSEHPKSALMEQLIDRMRQAYGCNTITDCPTTITWNIFILLGRK